MDIFIDISLQQQLLQKKLRQIIIVSKKREIHRPLFFSLQRFFERAALTVRNRSIFWHCIFGNNFNQHFEAELSKRVTAVMSDGPPICDMRWHLLDPLYNWGSSERALPLPLCITIIPPYAYCSSHHLLAVGVFEATKKSSVSK